MQKDWKFQRGDIYFTRFDSNVGSEQGGDRPAVIIQNNVGNKFSPTVIVATLTSKVNKKPHQPTHFLLENHVLKVPSIVQAEQIFTVDKSRFLNYMGHVSDEEMRQIDDVLKNSLALNPMGDCKKVISTMRSRASYAPPKAVKGETPIYPYTPIKSTFEGTGTVEEIILYMELQAAIQAMIQRLEYSFTFHPSLLTSTKRRQQVRQILQIAEQYIWSVKEEIR